MLLSFNILVYNEMKKANQLLKPQKKIKIPVQFLKKLDKVSLLELRETQQHFRKQAIHPKLILPNQNRKSCGILSNNPHSQRQAYSSLKSNDKGRESRDKNSKIRFRTTGAGFRQRMQHTSQQKNVKRLVQFNRPPKKIQQKQIDQQKYEQFAFKEVINKPNQIKIKKTKKPLKRIYFGQLFSFKQKAQYQYDQKFLEEDFNWRHQSVSYKEIGFGIDTNLTKFDFQSLDDPQGELFLSQFKGTRGYCPFFKDKAYIWIQVQVLSFDKIKNQVIVHRLGQNDVKNVSRLSIKFYTDLEREKKYWKRISTAKNIRKKIKQQQKYLRYITQRKQQFSMQNLANLRFNLKNNDQIQAKWFVPYCKQFLIFKQMYYKPQKFQSMGIQIRYFTPFVQVPIVKSMPNYKQNQDFISSKHYSRFNKFPQTLYKLFERLNEQSCLCVNTKVELSLIEDLIDKECSLIKTVCNHIKLNVRELLLSDIYGVLAFAFKNKMEQKKYIKIHNFIFKDLIIMYLYQMNVQKWLDFMSYFLTWTINTPEAIIKMSLGIDHNSKQIIIQPSVEKTKDLLNKPVAYLQKSIQQIPDILSELLGGQPTQISIKRSLKALSKQIIDRVTTFSFEQVHNYCKLFKGKLKYLQKLSYQKQQFSDKGKRQYTNFLQQLLSDITEANNALIFRSGIFSVDASGLKQTIRSSITKQKNRLGRLMEKQIQQQVIEMTRKFKEKEDYLKIIPKDEEQLVKMREYLKNQCQQFLDYAYEHYKLCLDFLQIFQDYFIELNFRQYQEANQIVMLHSHLINLINSKLTQLSNLEQMMIEEINNQRDNILKQLQDLAPKIIVISKYSQLALLSECYVYTSRTYHELQKIGKQLENINHRQRVLGQQVSIFPIISKMERQLRPYFDVWNMAYTLNSLLDSINLDPICELKYQFLFDKVSQLLKQQQRLSSFFVSSKNTSALGICQGLSEKISFIQNKLWIIKAFTLQGMLKKQGIRKEILNTIFKDKEIKFSQINFQILMAENIQVHKDFIIKNSQKAQRIWQLQLKISGIVNEVKKLQFQFGKNNQLPFVEQKILLSLSCAVHEQIEVMEAIKDLQQASYLTKKVNSIYSKLVNIEETLLGMIKFQEVFFPIVQLLKIQELSKEMGKEAATFQDVEKIWKNMCNHFLKDVQLWEAIETDSYKNRLQNGLSLLEIVDKKLTEVIDKKRHGFPRLFFVPQSLFRDLLLDDTLLFSSQIMPLLFTGIKQFIYQGNNYINGLIGWDNQQISFKKTLSRSTVWEYLKFVEQQMSKIMQWELNFKSNKTQKYIFSKATKILCDYTYFIQQAIASNQLTSLLAKIAKQIEQLALQLNYENTIYTSHMLLMRDKVSYLEDSNTYESSQFQWRKQLKYYVTERGGVQLKTFHISLPFKDQYTGNLIRPLSFIGEKACYQSIILAWNMNTGLMIDKNSQETVRQICGTAMRHYVTYKIHQNTQQQDIIYSLRGYLCSSAWLSLESIGPLSKENFEIIVQAAFEVHSAVQKERTLFYLGGQPMNVERSFKFNLFIALQTAINQKIPIFLPLQARKAELTNTKFGIVFRTFSWTPPSQMILSKFKLQSLGLQKKQVKSIMNLFELLLIEKERQWYEQSFVKIIDRATKKIYASGRQQIYQIIVNQLQVCLSQQQIQQITKHIKFPNTNSINFEQIIKQIQLGSGNIKNQVLLLGNPLSGKDFMCKQSFRKLNIQLQQILEYDANLANKWQYLSFSLYSKNIPSSQKLVVRAYKTDTLTPVEINHFVVYYHKGKLSWKNIVEEKIKDVKVHNQIRIQAIRQIDILFNLAEFHQQYNQNNSLQIAFTLSFFKFLQIFITANKIKSLGQIPRTQLIFMLIYWQSYTFFPKITLIPGKFGSNLDKQPMNYYFEIQKSAWIQWATLPLQYFNKNAEFINEIFLPIKETVSFIYFFANMVPFTNIWVQAQNSGIGLHKTIDRSIKKELLQFYKAHKNIDYEGISNLVTYNIAIFKKQGKYFPKLGQSLVICIEDVNLPNTPQFGTFINALLNHSYEKNKKRVLAKSTFICTSCGPSQASRQYLGIAKNTVKMNALSPSQQSKITIYNYYLEWFFGNTQNPFSKEVRNATELIVKMSLFIEKEASLNQNNQIRFCHIVKIFEGLCQCSPKSVKTTQQILQLWLQQYQNQFSSQKRSANENYLVKNIINLFLHNEKSVDKKLLNLMKIIIQRQTPIFIRLPSLQYQYSQTYRKIPNQLLINSLYKLIQKLDYKKFSYFPLVIFQSLISHIIKVIRVINIPQRHLLIYGGKSSGKVTIARIASFLVCEKDINVINSSSAWKDQVGKYLNQIKKEARAKSLIFKLKKSDSEQFMMTIEEILYLSHPRSLIFDKNSGYLQNLSISSSNSQQYKDFKQLSQRYLHCIITYPSLYLKQLNERYPYMLRKVEFMNIQGSYQKNGPYQICKASIGRYYQDFSILQKANQIFVRNGIEMNQGKLIKISQMALDNFEKCIRFVQQQQKRYKQSIQKIRLTERQKLELEKELDINNKLLAKLSIKVQELRKDYKDFQQQYQDKVKDYNEHNEQCEIQRGKTQQKRLQVENELNKVLPMLKAAEDAMAKVTRDDINQLRSFPNPPLPAAKVVESLIFLFNESQLVKQKVLEDGRKIRDFWEYAKKFILNDRLLKRVEDFKPDTIKNLDQTIVETLKQIIKKPQFLQQRVFKASVAAGNLSLWIKAILAVYDVMQMIQPKKKLLMQAQQALRQREELLKNELDQLNRFHVILMQKKKHYELKLEQKDKVQSKIIQLQHFISNGKQILGHLQPRERQWKLQIEQKLKILLQYCQQECLLAAIQINILTSLNGEQRAKIINELFSVFSQKEIFKKKKYKFTCLRYYQQYFHRLCFDQQRCEYFSLNQQYSQSLICFHELIAINQPIIIIIDKTYQFMPYISFPSIAKEHNLNLKIIDCLLFKQFSDCFMVQNSYTDDGEQSDEQNIGNTENNQRNILLITNICHRPNFMAHFNNIPKMYGNYQLIFLQNELNSEFSALLKQQQLQINIIIQNTEQLNNYFLKKEFDINIEEIQQLKEFVYTNRVRSKIIDLFCGVENIILSQDDLQEWIANNNEDIMITKSMKGVKKSNKGNEEKVKQITDLIFSKRIINIPKHLQHIREYFANLIQPSQRSLINYCNWLKDKLSNWPQSLIKIISTNYQTTNPLAYYLLKFGKIQQLEKNSSLQPKKKQSQQTEMGKIMNRQYEIIDPHSMFHVLNKNLNAFICITDKYKLKKALQQCKIIEQAYKTQYIDEFLEREQFSYIYLISQCGSFYAQELQELKQETLKQVITYGEWKTGKFNEAYQLQRLHRKYQTISAKDKQYFSTQFFNRSLIFHTQISTLYSSLKAIKQTKIKEGMHISKIKKNKQNRGQLQLGHSHLQFLSSGSKNELTLWQIQELLYKQYFR